MKSSKKLRCLFLIFTAFTFFSSAFAAQETNIFSQRRDRLRRRLEIDAKAVLFSGVSSQLFDKNFFYLTGIKEPLSMLLSLPIEGDDFLFIPDVSNKAKLKTIARISGITQILPMKEFEDIFSYLYSWQNKIYFLRPSRPDDYGYNLIRRIMNRHPQFVLKDLAPILNGMRMVKSPEEIALLNKAIGITASGLVNAIRQSKPGLYEYEIQKTIEDTFMALGAEGTSFNSIIGSGPNSVIIHYDQNTRMTEPGDLVVMDVGAEYSGYAGDLTRTMPISGKFTVRQREIYEIVLEAQRRAIEACRPGITLNEIDRVAREFIEGLGYGAYFTHRIGHSLGLDVHDPWFNEATFVPGVVITIEPGIYIAAENLGVRIEDDVLITEFGGTSLSSSLPKEPEDIERLMQATLDRGADQRILKRKEKTEPRDRIRR